MRLVLLGQPQDGLATLSAGLAPSLDPAVELICCDTPEQAPAWAGIGQHELVLLVERAANVQVDWRQMLISAGQPFQVIPPSDQPLWQALQWALGHHLHRTTGTSPWPLRTEIAPRWHGTCETCSDPACEHRLFRQLLSQPAHPAPIA